MGLRATPDAREVLMLVMLVLRFVNAVVLALEEVLIEVCRSPNLVRAEEMLVSMVARVLMMEVTLVPIVWLAELMALATIRTLST